MERFNNLHQLLERRRHLRKEMTYAEQVLWKHLRGEKLGAKFRRQHSITNFIVDFYCAELQLAIEVDGSTHLDTEIQDYDAWRQAKLESMDILFIRIPNPRLVYDGNQVAEEIRQAIIERRQTFQKMKYSKQPT